MAHNPGQGDDMSDDDLTRISGIGLKTAERLRAGGIRGYAALAARSPGEIMALLPDVTGLSTARVDAWREQALKFAAEAPAGPPKAVSEDEQHYESFLVRILLSEDGAVRRTTVQHVRTGQERHWPGLSQAGLFEFIDAATAVAPHPAEPEVEPAAEPQAEPVRERSRLASSVTLVAERTMLRAGEAFTLTMSIAFEEPPSAGQLIYSAVVVARPRTGGPKRTLAQADGLVAPSSASIDIKAAGLPAGLYRLDGAVSLRESGATGPASLAAISEGLLVQVVPA